MKKEKMDERCLRCRHHVLSKLFPVVLNKQARWVTGIHCNHYEMREEPPVIPSTRGIKCKYFQYGYGGKDKI